MADIIQITAKGTAQNVPQVPSIANQILNFLASYWWIGLVIIVVLGLILWGIWRLMESLKAEKYPIYELYKQRKSMCKQQRESSRFLSFFKPKKNNPIVCQWMENGVLNRKVIGYYYGDYYSSEGNRNLAFFKRGEFVWFFIPVIKILLLNKKPKHKVKIEYKEGKEKKVKILSVEVPTEIDFFTDKEIVLLGAKSVDKLDEQGMFFVPILIEDVKNSNQLDLSSYAYNSLTEVIKGEQLITNLNYFVTANKKALEINPSLRAKKQVEDNSGEVEDN